MNKKQRKQIDLGQHRPTLPTAAQQPGLPTFGLPRSQQQELRRRREAAGAGVPLAADGDNRMPLPVGQIYQELSDEEKKVLSPLGWKPGDPVPPDFAEQYQQMQATAAEITQAAKGNLPLPGNATLATPPLELPPEVPLESLSPAHQQKLRESLLLSRQLADQQAREEASLVPGADASVNAAIRAAETGLRVMDDRQQPATTTTPTAETVAETAPSMADVGSAVKTVQLCPQCGHDQAILEVVEVTDQDQDAFAVSLLGGIPFSKQYTLLKGRLQITLRSLRTHEYEATFRQVQREYSEGTLISDTDRWEKLQRYQALLQLQAWSTPDSSREFCEDLTDWANSGEEPLRTIESYFERELFTGDGSAYRLLLIACARFNRLVARLEALATEEGFSQPTSSAR